MTPPHGMLLENMLVCIKGQINTTFICPLWVWGVCRGRWRIPGFMTTSCPSPSAPQSAAAHGLWKGEEPPLATVASHRHMDGGGVGAEGGQVRRRAKCEGSREAAAGGTPGAQMWEDVAEDLADRRDGNATAEKGARARRMLGFNRPGQWDVGAKQGFEKRGQAACCCVCLYGSPLLVVLKAPRRGSMAIS